MVRLLLCLLLLLVLLVVSQENGAHLRRNEINNDQLCM
jgi:hypothetical protein